MNTAQQNPVTNIFMLVLAFVALVGGIVGYYYLDDQASFVRTLVMMGGVVLAAVISLFTHQGRTFFEFLKGANLERRKVVWPTHTETIQTTIIIGIVTLIVSIVLFGLDTFFSWVVKMLISGGA